VSAGTTSARAAGHEIDSRSARESAVRRTLLALVASALAAIPLCTLLRDRGWLVDVWLTMLVVIVPALLMRLHRPPGALQVWPGIVLLVPWLTARFLSGTAWHGFVPTSRTWHRISALLTQLHHTANDEVAPVHSTVAIKLAICAILGLLAALVDLIAVVGRHGALAGVPLLVVYTVGGAVPHRPVPWLLFLAPAVGFLLLLGLDAREDRLRWGHRVARPGRSLRQPAGALAGQRIAVLALVVAVVIPLVTPASGTNLVSLLLRHHGGSGMGSGSINPFAALKGQLTRTKLLDLARVDITAASGTRPFYLREQVLPVYTGAGWGPARGHGPTIPVEQTTFASTPDFGDQTPQRPFTARITVVGLTDNPPVFAVPTQVLGLPDARWSGQDQLLVGTKVHAGQSYTEVVTQPAPTLAELRVADAEPNAALAAWLRLPKIPKPVHALVHRLIAGKHTAFQRARAINNFFLDPSSGFTYSLQTTAGDSGSDLVDFLDNRTGYCQQYAAAMAVMLRMAGVPARVVLGYAHAAAKSGSFTITTADAHAWVEAYFGGVGWVPFDPTPAAGLPAGHASVLPYARFVPAAGSGGQSGANSPSASPTAHHPQAVPTAAPGGAVQADSAGATGVAGWLVGLVVLAALLALALLPWWVRTHRRRVRLRAARAGDPDPLWAELADTALDLGYVWSSTRTPRQVARGLGRSAGDAQASLATLARAVEEHRYAGPDGSAGRAAEMADLGRELGRITARLRSGRTRSDRFRAALWPASLRRLRCSGWGRHESGEQQ
jgi:transglutaminase-like putative cysteine protease